MELATAIGFSAELFMPILDALAGLKVKGKRRKGQTYHPQCINFFTVRRFFTTLEVILERIYRLGGIKLSEHSTKFLTSLMLQVAGATLVDLTLGRGSSCTLVEGS